MAEYEASAEQIKQLTDANTGLSDVTKSVIQALVDGGTSVSFMTGDVTGSKDDAALVAQNSNLNNATFTQTELFVVDSSTGSASLENPNPVTVDVVNSNLDALDFKNNADNTLSISNSVIGSVTTGDGNDNIGIEGNVKIDQLNTGSGNLELTLDKTAQEQAEISVDAGDGFDLLRLIGSFLKHTFSLKDGHFVMHSANIEMEGVNVVATDANADGKIALGQDHITVLAATEEESIVAKLYKVALGREAIDGSDGWGHSTLGGINWWFNEFSKLEDNDGSMEHLVRSFLNCDEFHNKYDSMSNEEYVNALFDNLGSTNADAKANLLNQLNSGDLDREEVAWAIARSDDAVKLLGTDGENYVIDGDFNA